jgi:FkbM family methyltransferase
MNLIRKIQQFSQKKEHMDVNFRKSYSQCGEDMIVDYIFRLRGINRPSYIDIGANHPYFISNTAMFYERGCRGINVEANPQLIPVFQTARSEDTNLNVGIGDKEGELDFYIMENNTLSSFSKKECAYLVSNGQKLLRTEKIRVTTVSAVLSDYFNDTFPDFLSLDVEGMDFDILKSINWERHYPKVICVEAAEFSPTGSGKRRSELIDFLEGKGFYEYANTNLNAIMVNRSFWFI